MRRGPLLRLAALCGAVLAPAARCAPLRLPPAEEAQRRIEEAEGPWYPCAREVHVSRAQSPTFLHDALGRCEAGDGASCMRLAVVERRGCSGRANPGRAVEFATKACDRNELSGCLARVDMCLRAEVPCSDDARAASQARAVAVATRRCLRGSDDDCATADGWYRDGELGLPAESGRIDRMLSAECDRGNEPACAPLARRAVKRGEASTAEAIYGVRCGAGASGAWACDALWGLAKDYERAGGSSITGACRVYRQLCRVGQERACTAATRLGTGC